MLIVLGLFSSILLIDGAQVPKGVTGSREESAVIYMGALNEELRTAQETMKSRKLGARKGYLLHINHLQQIEKRTYMAPGSEVFFHGYSYPDAMANTSFTFKYYGISAISGKVSFYENGKQQQSLMIHLGTMTLDVRNP
jgi:hypothetical protein